MLGRTALATVTVLLLPTAALAGDPCAPPRPDCFEPGTDVRGTCVPNPNPSGPCKYDVGGPDGGRRDAGADAGDAAAPLFPEYCCVPRPPQQEAGLDSNMVPGNDVPLDQGMVSYADAGAGGAAASGGCSLGPASGGAGAWLALGSAVAGLVALARRRRG